MADWFIFTNPFGDLLLKWPDGIIELPNEVGALLLNPREGIPPSQVVRDALDRRVPEHLQPHLDDSRVLLELRKSTKHLMQDDDGFFLPPPRPNALQAQEDEAELRCPCELPLSGKGSQLRCSNHRLHAGIFIYPRDPQDIIFTWAIIEESKRPPFKAGDTFVFHHGKWREVPSTITGDTQ